jgi:enoyl-CoA hydratase/carnithine racemase
VGAKFGHAPAAKDSKPAAKPLPSHGPEWDAANAEAAAAKVSTDRIAVLEQELAKPETTAASRAALQAELDQIAANDSVRAVVIGGRGAACCAGHDLREMRAEPSLAYYQKLFARCSKMMMTIQRMPQPVLARVHGIATAAGCQLVAACELAWAADDARFAVSGVNLGLFCSTPSVALSRNLSRKAAMRWMLCRVCALQKSWVAATLVDLACVPAQATRAWSVFSIP